jgi:hypothetical protein
LKFSRLVVLYRIPIISSLVDIVSVDRLCTV